MADHVDARSSVAVVLVSLILLVYMAVGPRGRDQVLVSVVILLVLVMCMILVPRGTGRDQPAVLHCKRPAEYRAVGEASGAAARATPTARRTAAARPTTDALDAAMRRAAEAVGAATVAAEALGASAPTPDPPPDPNDMQRHDLQPNRLTPAAPLPQVAGEVVDPIEAVDALGRDPARIAEEIERNLFRGSCPEFIPALGPTPELYTALVHTSTQAQLNELQANSQERIWSPYDLWNRRFRLETALAADLLTWNRNEGRGPKDWHLQEVTPAAAAAIIAESTERSRLAALADSAGTHIGYI